MLPKREAQEDRGTPPKRARKVWTDAEEKALDKLVFNIVKDHLWARAKADPVLAARGQNGVTSHWEAKVCIAAVQSSPQFKKMSK